jgi:DNA-binding NtrC family response regulator
MLRLLERFITEKTPYQIITTSNALEAPGLLEAERFDLIISDLKMPGMDGLDLLRHVRATCPTVEVIIMTAFGSLETVIDALRLGAADYIAKPFKREQMIQAVDRAMRRRCRRLEADSLHDVLGLTPYTAAAEAFAGHYVRRLLEQAGSDTALAARISGLTEGRIRELSVEE